MRIGGGIAIALVAAAITGCDPTPQDKGSVRSRPVSGLVAADGPLAHALVFADTNDNLLLDAWEPFAYTDGEGRYSTASDGTDYCVTDPWRCLRVDVTEPVAVRATGGYDRVTGGRFTGTLSREISDTTETVTTPITTLLARIESAEIEQKFIESVGPGLNITRSEMESQLLDFDNDLTLDQRRLLVTLAIRAQKMAEVVSAYLEARYDCLGSDGMPEDATGYLYDAIADEWTAVGRSADTANIIDAANQSVATACGQNLRPVPGSAKVDRLMTFIADEIGAASSRDSMESRLRAIEIFAALLGKWDATVIGDLSSEDVTELEALATELATFSDQLTAQADIPELVGRLEAWLRGWREALALDPSAPLPDFVPPDYSTRSALAVDDLNGLSLASENDAVSFALNDDGTVSIALDFESGSGLTAAGEEITGTVESLNDYTLLLNLEIGGIVEPVIVRSNYDENGAVTYTFDYDGNDRTWQ